MESNRLSTDSQYSKKDILVQTESKFLTLEELQSTTPEQGKKNIDLAKAMARQERETINSAIDEIRNAGNLPLVIDFLDNRLVVSLQAILNTNLLEYIGEHYQDGGIHRSTMLDFEPYNISQATKHTPHVQRFFQSLNLYWSCYRQIDHKVPSNPALGNVLGGHSWFWDLRGERFFKLLKKNSSYINYTTRDYFRFMFAAFGDLKNQEVCERTIFMKEIKSNLQRLFLDNCELKQDQVIGLQDYLDTKFEGEFKHCFAWRQDPEDQYYNADHDFSLLWPLVRHIIHTLEPYLIDNIEE